MSNIKYNCEYLIKTLKNINTMSNPTKQFLKRLQIRLNYIFKNQPYFSKWLATNTDNRSQRRHVLEIETALNWKCQLYVILIL